MSKPKLTPNQYEFFNDRLNTVSLIIEGLLQQHPVAKINPQIKDHISASVDELHKVAQYIRENC